jgi:hypothetical protein
MSSTPLILHAHLYFRLISLVSTIRIRFDDSLNDHHSLPTRIGVVMCYNWIPVTQYVLPE